MTAQPVEQLPIDDTAPATGRDGGSSELGTRNSAETPGGEGSTRVTRACAREGTPIPFPTAPVTDSDEPGRLRALAAWAGETFQAPEIWDEPRPPLKDVVARARHGEWTKADGICRKAGVAYACLVAVPVAAACRYVDWVVERPSRLVVALITAGLVVIAVLSYV